MRSQTDRSAAPSFEEGVTFQERRTMRKLAFAVAVVMLLVCNSAYAFEQRTIEEHTIERHTYEQRSIEPSPPAYIPPTLLANAMGRWAIGGECWSPSKTYSLTVNGGTIIWQDGLGNIDVEAIIFSSQNEFQTSTVNSMHRSGGYPMGTYWNYAWNGNGIIVTKNVKNSFYIVRCS